MMVVIIMVNGVPVVVLLKQIFSFFTTYFFRRLTVKALHGHLTCTQYSRLCCGACFCSCHPCRRPRHHRSPFWGRRSYSVVSSLRCCWCSGRRPWCHCPALCSLFPLSPFWRTGAGGGRCRRRRPNTEVRTEFPTLHYVQSSEREGKIKDESRMSRRMTCGMSRNVQ